MNRYPENKENKGFLLPTAPSSLTLARAFYLLLINLSSWLPYHVENYIGYETIPQIAPISWDSFFMTATSSYIQTHRTRPLTHKYSYNP